MHGFCILATIVLAERIPALRWRDVLIASGLAAATCTQQEMQIYERTRRELEKEEREAVWEEKNAALRRLGLRTIPNLKMSHEDEP